MNEGKSSGDKQEENFSNLLTSFRLRDVLTPVVLLVSWFWAILDLNLYSILNVNVPNLFASTRRITPTDFHVEVCVQHRPPT